LLWPWLFSFPAPPSPKAEAEAEVQAVVVEAAVGPVADPPGAAQAALPLQVLQAQLRHLLEQQGPVALLPERTEVRRPGQKVQETPD
jgi:hypothetical protein